MFDLCKPGLSALWLGLILPTVTWADSSALPKGTNVTSLTVITDGNRGNAAQKVLIATLQGTVARQSGSQIYIDSGSGYSIWDSHLHSAYGIPLTTVTSPWTLLTQYRSLLSGYVLYNQAANSNSVNAATSLCGPFNAVAVDASIEATVRSYGLTNLIVDVSAQNEGWVWTNYHTLLNRSVVIEQKESFADDLRDYATLAGAFTFYDGNSPFRSYIMGQMSSDSACLGWGDASRGESVFVGDGSSNGVFTIAADWTLNLSTLSGIRDSSVYQRTYTPPLATATNVHYVTFLLTDGDNVQMNLGSLAGYFNQPARGTFDMGWALSPSLADLAPSVLRWYFDNSSNGPSRDFFVAGPSGCGYMYPSQYPRGDLSLHAQRLNAAMTAADLNIAQIIDFNAFTNAALWNKYLAQPNIDALFYLEYSRYNALAGALYFTTNGKPVLSASDLLWAGLEEDTNLIANLNAAPIDIASPAGYSLVLVHYGDATYKKLTNVQFVATNLASGVRVVTPDAFVKLVRANVGRKLSYDFATGLQGWVGATNGGALDKAAWNGITGNPPGALQLDGSDYGHSNATRNGWFSRQILLPPNATTLSFETLARNDGQLRVRLQPPDGTWVTLLDWEKLATANTWVTRTASLTNFAGQTVTLCFEQNDGGRGSGEQRYVDNVAVLTAGPALYLPAAPRLLTATAGNSVALLWRDNDNNEAGFKVERSAGASGAWGEVASLPGPATTWADASVAAGTNYSYRLRSWNAQGFSPYSNPVAVTTPARPVVTSAFAKGALTLSWPGWATNFALYGTSNLGPAASWSPATNTPAKVQGALSVALPAGPGARFFQLRTP